MQHPIVSGGHRPPASVIHLCVQTPPSENPGSAPVVCHVQGSAEEQPLADAFPVKITEEGYTIASPYLGRTQWGAPPPNPAIHHVLKPFLINIEQLNFNTHTKILAIQQLLTPGVDPLGALETSAPSTSRKR